MHRSESYDRGNCIECGAEVSGSRERAFIIGGDDVLCFGCAIKRGGRYDEGHDHWDKAPSLAGLSVDAGNLHQWK